MAKTLKNIYYPDNYEAEADIPADMKELAESVDEAIKEIERKIQNYDDTEIKEVVNNHANRLDDIEDTSAALQTLALKHENSIQQNKQGIDTLKNRCSQLESFKQYVEESNLNGYIEPDTSIVAKDSDKFFGKLNLYGGQRQKTRSGKNRIDLAKIQIKTLNGITSAYNAKDNSVTFNGTCTEDNTGFDILSDTINAVKGKTTLTAVYVSGSCNAGSYANIRLFDQNWANNISMSLVDLNSNNKVKSVTYNADNIELSKFSFRFNKDSVVNNFTIKLMVTDEVDTEYEQFGKSPSEEYPSEIEYVGDNVNILENKATSKTVNGVEYTIFEDGTVIANGTATEVSYIVVNKFVHSAGTYTLNGCPARRRG